MRRYYWKWIEGEKVDYLSKFSVAVVGSRMLLNLLWRMGIGCIRYISDFVTPNDVLIDATLHPLEASCYDIVHPYSEESCIISYFYPEDVSELRKLLRGIDVVVAHRHIEEVAEVAEKIGAPFIPNIVTTFLPDGVQFSEVTLPSVEYDPISYAITCSVQAAEILKILTGYDLPVIAPEAILVDLRAEGYLRKIELVRKDGLREART
ncbi:MAG: hypothetical protein ABWW66_01605 [Archaeoglobaceae archaeon]